MCGAGVDRDNNDEGCAAALVVVMAPGTSGGVGRVAPLHATLTRHPHTSTAKRVQALAKLG